MLDLPRLADHRTEFQVLVGIFAFVSILGVMAARWRRPQSFNDLDSWGLGNRSFGPFVTWFLLGGDIYTAYTFVAVPALMYAAGAPGFFAVPFAVMAFPLAFNALTRMWSVAHVHGLVTPADFVRARFGSRTLALLVAITGIVATMPYIALQLIGIQAVCETVGIDVTWSLTVAFTVLAVFTYRSGLRAPAMIAFVKDPLVIYVVLSILLMVAMTPGTWGTVFSKAGEKFKANGLLLAPTSTLSYVTLAIGSALALFLYPHAITGVLAARNRNTVRRSFVALPIYTLMLGLMALVGYIAIARGLTPIGYDKASNRAGDPNTIAPVVFHDLFPGWTAGIAFAAIGVGALVPAAVMSIAAANLFTRNIYREYLRPRASQAEEANVSRIVSLLVKFGAVACILFVSPQFSLDFQLIGSIIVLQTLPAVALGLYTRWFHRYALVAGLIGGLAVGLGMLFRVPRLDSFTGKVASEHFGGSAWPLFERCVPRVDGTQYCYGGDFNLWGTKQSIYVGIVAIAVNLMLAVALTPLLRKLGVRDGVDITWRRDYHADEGDSAVRRMSELVDGGSVVPLTQRDPKSRHGQVPAEHQTPDQGAPDRETPAHEMPR